MLVDFAPQASMTIALGYPQPDQIPVTVTDLMTKIIEDEPIQRGEGIIHHKEDIDLLPANIQLSGMEVIATEYMKYRILHSSNSIAKAVQLWGHQSLEISRGIVFDLLWQLWKIELKTSDKNLNFNLQKDIAEIRKIV